jgi:hypothetical protein
MASPGFPSLTELCANPDAFFERLDVGALNLICASGLPGAETLDVAKCLDWLDDAARQAEFQIRRHWYRFVNSPETYHNSPGYFCCYYMLQVLQVEFGVKYNPARIKDPKFQDVRCFDADFKDSRDLFIHGIIDGPGGTCGSMPIIYVAVGRRLGYPLKLVETRGHLFFRWEDLDGKRFGFPEQFNVEGAGEGIHMYPDQHYREWPEPWSKADIEGDYYLKSQTPSQELAGFLVTRGECLADNGRIEETIQCLRWACALAPNDPRYKALLQQYTNRLFQKSTLALEYEQEKRRRQKERLGETTRKELMPGLAHHARNCRCFQCEEFRKANEPVSAPGHTPDCQCIMCLNARIKASPPGIEGHARNCECTQCREVRSSAAKAKGMPGHGPSCQCFQCKESRSTRSSGAPGHPPGCGCFQCVKSQHPAGFPW